jgi:hypothetical protein
MKAIAFANRLSRDLGEKSVIDLTADARLELLDATNGSLQKLHAIAPLDSKTTMGSIPLEAPVTATIGVTTGSAEVTGDPFTIDQFYRTIRIGGDAIDNQIVGPTNLLHPYAGATGTITATIYCDGVAIFEPYDELIGDPLILETGTRLTHLQRQWGCMSKPTGRPDFYHVEANARNQNSAAPSVIRFDRLPDRSYRLEAKFTLAPARMAFADLLAPGADIPLRSEYVEVYLLPIARGILTSSSLWKNKETKANARSDSDTAERKYEALATRHVATPRNFVRTKRGF